jgi:tRNA (guanine-N(7)-)-methyltransferase subunit TRM82
MPKRPCSIRITPGDNTIISADKFGDVYSLPLIQTEESIKTPSQSRTPEPSKPFLPAANELTIHSKRNLKALENQRRQTNQASEKSSDLTFSSKLLLGHVSMLTDVLIATLNGKEYILTADRDEHIRVSRGIPQTHAIESFCLGHEEFVTRLCVPEGREEVLISGGGDDEVFIWEWVTGKLISRFEVKGLVVELLGEKKRDEKIVVSGIFHMRQGEKDLILLSFEG